MYARQSQILRHLQPAVARPLTAQLGKTAASAALLHTTAPAASTPIKNVVVYGSGLMGSGIVQVAAQNNFQVTMVDLSPEMLNKGQGYIQSSLQRVARKKFADSETQQQQFIDEIMTRVKTSTDPMAPAESADLVIEAIVENVQTKRNLFSSLDAVAPRHTIFTSNTSSLPIARLAEATAPERVSRFAGLHFFNPVPQMKLVEVVQTPQVDAVVVDDLVNFCLALKKSPVRCKDTPGFIVNRLLVPYMMEAMRLVERGEATPEDVDTAMKLGAGYPMGPFQLADYVGLDTMKFINDGWFKEGEGLAGKELVSPSKTLDELVKAGKLGRKSGEGFYKY
ncbi:hypothetical protein H4R33_005413 [Dimargaris cristalligena]|uniref:3-hydroxyacyl-CoA dehydrogenase n=1 Tax=Dimargaris cristalligena TaxID=215637 RepID=A0A4P9ZV51_9FUNG|nr:hypothetical protein H4R33_005413 [Dimargaris cristalligena]RKP37464.1 3-hydroxyacyl-CoA dehydrogenase [Dimargaris cristalligena]|eukprot:RKP37464.1 3-hydroxyacyl-CoA dehydrogenase [Dimargaris cristalligena]